MSQIYDQIFALTPDSVYDVSDSSNNWKLWNLFSKQMSEIDDVFSDMRYLHDPDKQSGAVLDLIGEIRRETRSGQDDVGYRIFLAIAIQKLLCGGSVPELQEVLKAIAGDEFVSVIEVDYAPEDNAALYLDGGFYLTGEFYLFGDTRQPKHIEIILKDTISDSLFTYISSLIDYVKSAGTHYRIRSVEA